MTQAGAGLGGIGFDAPWPVERYREIDSTNAEARRRAEAGEFGPVWIVGDVQTLGRGRLGRSWRSPAGNLAATALFPYWGRPAEAPLLCFACGLALAEAIERIGAAPGSATLKWPNDLEVDGAKLAGILIETGQTPVGGVWAAAGIGVNVEAAPDLPDRKTARTRDLTGAGQATAGDLLLALDDRLRAWLARLAREGFAPVRNAWLSRTVARGSRIEARIGEERLLGAFHDLGPDGALIIRTQAGLRDVRAGDISLVGGA